MLRIYKLLREWPSFDDIAMSRSLFYIRKMKKEDDIGSGRKLTIVFYYKFPLVTSNSPLLLMMVKSLDPLIAEWEGISRF